MFLLPSATIGSQKQVDVLIERRTYPKPHLVPLLHSEGNILERFIVEKETIGGLNSITERNSQLPQQNSSSSRYFALINLEDTAVVSEHWGHVAEQFGKDSCLVVVLIDNGELRAVHESILLGGMPMKIQKHQQSLPEYLFVL